MAHPDVVLLRDNAVVYGFDEYERVPRLAQRGAEDVYGDGAYGLYDV